MNVRRFVLSFSKGAAPSRPKGAVLHGRNPPVPASRQRFDETRLGRRVAERRPDLGDAVVEAALEVDELSVDYTSAIGELANW